MAKEPTAASAVAPAIAKSLYPPEFQPLVAGRRRRRLGEHFGLANFGVNLTELAPGSASALLHHHTKQDEFVYIVAGMPTLVLGDEEFLLQPGDCCGFKAGDPTGHQLVNRTNAPVLYLEVGDRTAGDRPIYPNDDLELVPTAASGWLATHKDGTPY